MLPHANISGADRNWNLNRVLNAEHSLNHLLFIIAYSIIITTSIEDLKLDDRQKRCSSDSGKCLDSLRCWPCWP